MRRKAKEEGRLNPKKDSKKNEGKSQKMWSNHKKKEMKKVGKSNEI